jgi:gamma-glutamyltranspeptidase/glutathione hydrolase
MSLNVQPWVVEKKEIVVDSGVVASAHRLASQAGVEMLRKGGNAVDALVATNFALGVVEPFMSGIGGGGAINIRLSSGERCAIDCYISAPKKITSVEWPLPASGHKRGSGVPGVLAGHALALERYGTMSLEEVTKPAIKYAKNGFMIDSYIANFISSARSRLNSAGIKLLSKERFRSLVEGDLLINKNLAKTLELIGREGRDAFYKGKIAEMIVDDMEKNGGLITMEDLAEYEARVYEPAITTYRGYEVQSVPYAHGGVTVAHTLNVLERFDPKDLAYNTVKYYHILAESQKRIYADRQNYYGDHYFVRAPWEGILSKDYAEELSKQINMEKSSGEVESGDPWNFDEAYIKPDKSLKSSYDTPISDADSDCTTSFSVIDKDRNMAATTQSNGATFGSGVCVPGGGFFLNSFVGGFSPIPWHPNYAEPGKRKMNTHCPTLAFKDGRPFMAFGSPAGNRQQGAQVQTFVHVVDHGMDLQESISAPRAHCEGNTLWMERRIPEKIRETLRGMGHDVVDMSEYTMFFGGLNAVLVNPETGRLHGGADPRRPCAAVGY